MCRHMILLHIMLTSLTLLCSAFLILASLLVYNKESLEDFNARVVRLATGKGSDVDRAKTNPASVKATSSNASPEKLRLPARRGKLSLQSTASLQQLQQLYRHRSSYVYSFVNTTG